MKLAVTFLVALIVLAFAVAASLIDYWNDEEDR